jgi:uncharacterized zinc-type alcohol dehydrogenase-like protein
MMRGAVLHGPGDVRYEERPDPTIVQPTDAILRISATCVCGSDLWPYRGIQPIEVPAPFGHEYCGVVEEVGGAVTSVKPGQFVIDQPRKGLRPDASAERRGRGLPRDGREARDQNAADSEPNEVNPIKEITMSQNHSRRDFLRQSAVVGAGAVLAGATDAAAQQLGSAGLGPYRAEGMAAYSATGPLRRMTFDRRALRPKDVAIRIRYSGVCHSDIHTVRGDWGAVPYPLIVGHEIAGEVAAVGSSVSRFTAGNRVGVGTMVNSCRVCTECQAGHENYCLNGNTQTYGSPDEYGSNEKDGPVTQGGYSTFIVVDEDFVIRIPEAIDLAAAGPLLCAGITVYSPLRRWSVSHGQKVALIGMGGLGHLGVKLAAALGAEVTLFTTSPEKTNDAKRFGARDVVINRDGADWSRLRHTFDFALDTVPYKHDLNRFIPLLKRDATYCRVGVGKVTDSNEIGQMNLVLYRNALAGSNTGGVAETQDMVDFCARNQIVPEITKIPMTGIDAAWEKVIAKQARYRYVIDLGA